MKNQKGLSTIIMIFTLGMVMALGVLLLETLSERRLKYHAQIKEAFKIIGIMEEASNVVRTTYDRLSALNPAMTADQLAPLVAGALPPPAGGPGSCKIACDTLSPGLSADLAMCFDNVDNPSFPYCFYGNPGLQASLDFRSPDHRPVEEESMVADLFAPVLHRIDPNVPNREMELLNLEGYLGVPQRAFADTVNWPTASHTAMGAPITCHAILESDSPTVKLNKRNENEARGCLDCGPGTGRVCGVIQTCPKFFQSCKKLQGGQDVFNPFQDENIFRQNFVIL